MPFRANAVFLDLIHQIYGGAIDANTWPKILANIHEFIGAKYSLLFTSLNTPEQGGFVFTHQLSDSFMQQYLGKYIAADVWTEAGLKKNFFVAGNVVLDTELLPTEEFLESQIYREFLVHHDMAQGIFTCIFGVETQGVLPAVCSLMRGLHDTPFNEEDRRKMKVLVNHLSRSLGIMFRLRDSELKVASSLAALDRLSSGVVIVNSQGQVAFANQLAMKILGEEDGLQLKAHTTQASTLIATEANDQTKLQQAISTCVNIGAINVPHFSQSQLISRPSGKAAYALHFSALPYHNEFGTPNQEPHAIIFITDTTQTLRLTPSILQSTYNLTEAEIRIAQQCLIDDNMSTMTGALGLSENTIKTHLSNIYQKCGINTRAQLMKILMGMASV